MLQVSTVTSGPTGFHCYQWSNTLRYIFPLLSVVQHGVLHISIVISGPTLCVTYSHSYQWSNTVCYRFPLLSVVQHCVLHVSTVISGPTLPASVVKYVCTGSTAILPWTISLSPGEDIVDIRWLFRGNSEEVVAMSNHGTFVALPAYQQKASNVPNAGIALRQVTPSDTDNGA